MKQSKIGMSKGQTVVFSLITVIVGLTGGWWYEIDQSVWSWPSFIFTSVFIVTMIFLITYIEASVRRKIKENNK